MKKLTYLLVFCPFVVLGQIDESDTLNLKAKLALTGFWQRGNVQTDIFRGRTDFGVRTLNKWVYKNTNSYVYQAFGLQKADEDILSLNFLYFNPEKKIYPLALAFFSTNFRRQINRRYLVGSGFTYQVIRKEKHWLKFSLTGEYEDTEFNQTTFNLVEFNGSSTVSTFRGTFWVNGKYKFFNDKLIITHESYIQPSLENFSNYRWSVDIGVELPISRYINFKINYLDTFESLVIANQQQDDRFISFGFTVKSY